MQALPLLASFAMMGMAKKPKQAPPPPTPQPPARAPVRDDEAAKEARRQRMGEMSRRQGRASTDLTGNAPTAAPTFTNETLGQ